MKYGICKVCKKKVLLWKPAVGEYMTIAHNRNWDVYCEGGYEEPLEVLKDE